MSLINKMLRDLDARHVMAGDRTLPNQVRSLPEQVKRPGIGRGVWVALGLTILSAAAFQTSSYWLPALSDLKLLPKQAAVVPPAPPPPTPIAAPTVVLQLPPPEQMLQLPAFPDASPPAAAAEATAAAEKPPVEKPIEKAPAEKSRADKAPAPPAQLAQAERALPESRKHNRQMDSAVAEAPRAQLTAPPVASLPPPGKPAAAARAGEKPAAAATPSAIDKQPRLTRAQEQAELEYRKGIAAYKQGHMAEATVLFKAALQEEPRHLAARQTLLSMQAGQKQWDEAQVLLKEGLDIMPAQITWAMALARIQVERGNAAAAWETLQKYMPYADKNADYQGFAGVLLQRMQKPHEAAGYYQAAVQLKPDEGRWWLGLGLAYEDDGRAADARSAFQRARSASGLTPEMAAVIDKRLR